MSEDGNKSSQLIQYDEMAARHNAAFAAFNSIFEAKFPRPVKPPIERDSLFVPLALVVMIVASVGVSGSRTILEFGGGVVGLAAFIMIEGAIVTYAFFKTRRDFTEARLKTIQKRAGAGLGLALVVAVVANVRHSLIADGEQTLSWINTAIQIAIGFSAPALAFISGDIMAVEVMANMVKARKADRTYQQVVAKWERAKNTAWNAEKSRWGVKIEVMKPPVPLLSNSIPERSNGNSSGKPALGHTKKVNASQVVVDYLEANPEAFQIDPMELARILEVGKSTVYAVLKKYKTQNGGDST